ncbi:hypothetical protein DSC_08810 [Pseudoxanthomonas spadix BD-a59]|jgi:hypothetical protein|uniref:DUF4124 domain-containing protein n=1 Tax=Pseudoxanthomonas spadix (strain BD-a59) TaxID=1045855 RepID=G7UVU3_PSEUP|nr:DUF4124 domain-containing protein [Pseudoxanthomonas spadix]AER56412.1 hypothetical protein DSC_08810 [Pseudoxanthomonas spadix BD-a59]
MKRIVVMALCLLAAGANAQSVYKCRDGAGVVVYQSQACSGRIEKQWTPDPGLAAAPSAERTAAERSIARDRKSLQASNRRMLAQQVQRRPVPPRRAKARTTTVSACQRARSARAAAHARKGLHWSFDDASRWDARVFKVCR